ncbi:MAG: VWA domain-containing protein [Acidobacteria bacterium]|nr:VWA domain-containing protein [Acidobacteriota bacterium]
MLRSSIFALSVFLSTLVLLSQERGQIQKQDKDYVIKVDVELVTLPVSVFDKDGRPVDGLTQDHFQILEDNTPQKITLFKHEDIPLSVGLIIDNSGSMRNKRERVNHAALSFVRESNPDDETFIVNFDDSAYLEQDFTSSIGDLIDALDNVDTRGETALYDALVVSVNEMMPNAKKDKKVILLISDGEDNASKYGINKALEVLRSAKDITVYAVGLIEDNDQRGGLFRKAPSKKAKDDLQKFAQMTGGQAFFPKSIDEVEEIVRRIAHDLRNQYTIGYTPSNANLDGTWRKIQVKVTPPKNTPKITVVTKEGYQAPGGVSQNR